MLSKTPKICLSLGLSIVLSACGISQNSIEAKRAGGELATVVEKVSPIAAKPNEVVNLTGSNFYEFKNLKARVETMGTASTDVPLSITDSRNASFVMPAGAGLGVKTIKIVQGTSAVEVGAFNLVADQVGNSLPIVIGDASNICAGQQYVDRNGETKTGTKDCGAIATKECTTDGEVGCVTTTIFKAANIAAASSKILTGQTLAGVSGEAAIRPDDCSSNGQQACVATGTYFAGTTCPTDGSNCFLPSYSIPGLQTKKAIDVSSIDGSKMLDSLTVSGVSGTITSKGSWDLTTAFPGAGYYAGVSNSPTAPTIASGTTIAGVAGSAALRPADCSTDGGVGCVVVGPSFAAAATSGAASKILSGQSVAGVSGNVTLPEVGKVLSSTQYGVSGTGSTGTLTLPLASNVLAGSGNYGDPGALVTPSLADRGTWNLTTSFPGAGYYSGTSNAPATSTYTGALFGTTGTAILSPANCSANGQQSCVATGSYFAGTSCIANGSGCYLPSYAITTQPLRAINYDNINTYAGNIRSSTTLGGVTGTLADCSTNAAEGCVTTAAYKSADLTNLSAGNIKSGVTIAGMMGQYPSSGFPLTGSSGTDLTSATFNAQIKSSATFQYFGSDGTRNTATGDADISAANIASGVDIFGTTGLFSGTAPDPWDVRIGKTINGVAGKLKVNCRNRINSSTFNFDGAIGSIGNSGVTTGSALDAWDTIDDYNSGVSGLPSSAVTSWGSNTDCGGVETTLGDSNVWKDVTTLNGNTASSCASTAINCTMQDKITGLWWSKLQAAGSWSSAWNTCQTTLNTTTYSGNSSVGYNGQIGWRLPTQKELMEAYTHGIRSAATTNWMTESNINSWFWSASSVSYNASTAWNMVLSSADANNGAGSKTSSYQVICVR